MEIKVLGRNLVLNMDHFCFAYRDDKNVLIIGTVAGLVEVEQRDGADQVEAFLRSQDVAMQTAVEQARRAQARQDAAAHSPDPHLPV